MALALLIGQAVPGLAADRRATELEIIYAEYAHVFGPEICEKISPRAHEGYTDGVFSVTFHSRYTKSACYFNLAMSRGKPEYCRKVVERGTLNPLNTTLITRSRCKKAAARRGSANLELPKFGQFVPDTSDFWRYMGIVQDGCFVHPVLEDYWARRTVSYRDEFRNRAVYLPDFSEDAPDLEAALAAARAYDLEYRKRLVDPRHRLHPGVDNRHQLLHQAAHRGNVTCIEDLLDLGMPVDVKSAAGDTALRWAASGRQAAAAAVLVSRGADVRARTESGSTPLHAAARPGNLRLVRLLLEAGAEIDAADDKGRTPLYWAVGHAGQAAEVTLYLLARGADPTAGGGQIIGHAARSNSVDFLRRLEATGESFDVVAEDGRTLLHEAVALRPQGGNVEAVKLLLAKGPPLDARSKDGSTPLRLAAQGGNFEAYLLLLEAGADPGIEDATGKIAADYGGDLIGSVIRAGASSAFLDRLLASGLSPNVKAPSYTDNSALETAVMGYDAVAVEILLAHGADPGQRTPRGQTLLQVAEDEHRSHTGQLRNHPCIGNSNTPSRCGGDRRQRYLQLVQRNEALGRIVSMLRADASHE